MVSSHVNKDLDAFTRCVADVIARFPLYEEDDAEEKFKAAAGGIRYLIVAIDGTALVHNGFWHGFCEGDAMGDRANWD